MEKEKRICTYCDREITQEDIDNDECVTEHDSGFGNFYSHWDCYPECYQW